jgi:sporulation protein YlmC with PRC-barrel domain
MPAISDVEGLEMVSSIGKVLGTVKHVLFHPTEPRAVGLIVVPRPFLFLFARKERLLLLRPEMLPPKGGKEFSWRDKKLPLRDESTKGQGFTWEQTVIWRYMEVRLESGKRVGSVADVVFGRKKLGVLRLNLSGGSATDVAVGRTVVPGELVHGFDGTNVVIDDAFTTLNPTGGLAASSAKVVVRGRQGVDKAADAALAAGVVGLSAVERSFTKGWGAKAVKAVKRAQKAAGKMGAPPDDEE